MNETKKLRVALFFGGVSSEHEVSCVSASTWLRALAQATCADRYEVFPVGITKQGRWLACSPTPEAMADGSWEKGADCTPCVLSPDRTDHGIWLLKDGKAELVHIDICAPVMHGKNGEDGTIQGLLQLAGIPYVGPHVAASAVAMDKTLTKLVADNAGIPQAAWQLVRRGSLDARLESTLDALEKRFAYPMFVKPAGTGSSVGVSKAKNRQSLAEALANAAKFDDKVLVEEFIRGKEIEVAVMGNESPVASVCGEIDSGVEFYDYDAKYITDTSVAYIPARISEEASEQVRDMAVKVYRAIGCQGLSRVDFFVTEEGKAVFNEINTIPGFTSISMYPKLFGASGIPYGQLIDQLLGLALEA